MIVKTRCILLLILPLILTTSACEKYPIVAEYQIFDKEFIAGGGADGISIIYPVISGMYDEGLQSQVNQLLYEAAIGYYMDGQYYVTEGLSVHAQYEVIYQDNHRLSVVFSGEPYVDGTAHPNWDYRATNIDLTTGEVICLKDFVSYEWLRQCFALGEVEFVSGIEEAYNAIEAEDTDLYNKYINNSFVYQDNMHTYDFYFDEQKIYLITRVPHPYGDYIVLGADLPQ